MAEYPITTTESAYYGGSSFGGYQFTSLDDIISQFIIAYVGEDKIISKIKRMDVSFHAMRGLQELSFDTFKSVKAIELECPATLQITLPQDYVNYVKLTWSDGNGIEHVIYPTSKTSNPRNPKQNADGSFDFEGGSALVYETESDTWDAYNSSAASEITQQDFDYDDDVYDDDFGQRYGVDPQYAQINGSFYIDEHVGKIHFSSNMSGKTVILKYISDSLGSTSEMKVHKFAEEAIYKYTAHAILSAMVNVPEYIVRRFQKDRRAAMRNAKLRLYDLDPKKMVQTMRGKSKQIKH